MAWRSPPNKPRAPPLVDSASRASTSWQAAFRQTVLALRVQCSSSSSPSARSSSAEDSPTHQLRSRPPQAVLRRSPPAPRSLPHRLPRTQRRQRHRLPIPTDRPIHPRHRPTPGNGDTPPRSARRTGEDSRCGTRRSRPRRKSEPSRSTTSSAESGPAREHSPPRPPTPGASLAIPLICTRTCWSPATTSAMNHAIPRSTCFVAAGGRGRSSRSWASRAATGTSRGGLRCGVTRSRSVIPTSPEPTPLTSPRSTCATGRDQPGAVSRS